MPVPRPLDALPLNGHLDPERAYLDLFAAEEASFWLDAGTDARTGWSILGAGVVETDAEAVRATPLTGHPVRDSTGIPFRGGWVGWLDYEQGAFTAGAPVATPPATGAWIAVTRALAVDHSTGRAFALAAAGDLAAWHQRVQAGLDAGCAASAAQTPAAAGIPAAIAHARHGAAEYARMVEECRAAIERGDAYQLCLTTRFTVPQPGNPVQVYRRLRRATPAHHGGFISVGERHLLSASPEQFLSVTDGVASTSPIKGTRPRGSTVEADRALAVELRADVKERAENVMIVDLMRNDLSQVGVPGTVSVPRLWQVETYPAVHQLVSSVTVSVRAGMTVGRLIDATFPAGSMTGAPKLSAMGLLHAIERGPRGVYSGCFGYVGLHGDVDLAMVIRSIVMEAEVAYVGAGGGITWLSKPTAEVAEVAVKARAPLAALGAVVPAEWAAAVESR